MAKDDARRHTSASSNQSTCFDPFVEHQLAQGSKLARSAAILQTRSETSPISSTPAELDSSTGDAARVAAGFLIFSPSTECSLSARRGQGVFYRSDDVLDNSILQGKLHNERTFVICAES